MKKIQFSQHRNFWQLHLFFPAIIAAFMVVVYPFTGWDQWFIAPYYSALAHAFPLRNDHFMQVVMHAGLKDVVIGAAMLVLAIFLLSFKVKKLMSYRRQSAWVLLGMVLADSAVSLLKQQSIHACPWDVMQYGGDKPWLSLFAVLPDGVAPGHCFPAGHASAGFALMAFYFAMRDTKPVCAKFVLLFALAYGFVMGWAQMMRGAHFFSHTVWSAWVVWMVLLLLHALWPPTKTLAKSSVS
ncbi:MAG: phosphatase PAP2 family protein [Rugosibacter sp.]|nr:phosphatase PAP2 family protein [Rugosibacter sp.]